MCGILGAVHVGRERVAEGLRQIAHRGRDHLAISCFEKERLCLAHTRLAIQDLSPASNQPLVSDDERFALIYNGEIYNHAHLSQMWFGRRFASDTLFLFEILRRYGDDREALFAKIREFRGFWAFGFFDAHSHSILLVRDLFGKKPLYYCRDSVHFAFASEIAALRPLLNRGFTLRREILPEVLKYRFSLSESPYHEVETVERGGWLRYDLKSETLEKGRYFDLFDLIASETPHMREGDAEQIERMDAVFQEAVGLRLVADVKVGTITSGGLDSSLVSAIANRFAPTQLFHVDVRYDSERTYAEALAALLKQPLHTVPFEREGFEEALAEARRHNEYPLAHPNSVGLLHLASLAAQKGYKVLLSGEGADESFGGYEKSASLSLYLTLRRFVPRKMRRIAVPLRKLFTDAWMLFMEEHNRNGAVLEVEEAMYREFVRYHDYYRRFYSDADATYQAFLAVQFQFYTRPLLLRADKIFMARGVELRSPFFDPEVVRSALLLPPKWKKGKKILKRIARNKIPEEIIERKKKGFPIPSTYYGNRPSEHPLLDAEQRFIKDSFERLADV